MGKREDPLAIGRLVHPARDGVSENTASTIRAQSFPRDDKYASASTGVRSSKETLQGVVRLVLSATMKVDFGLDRYLTTAQFSQRSFV